MDTPRRIRAAKPVDGKKFAALQPVLHKVRWECARTMEAAFPDRLARFAIPGLPVSTISKGRRGYESSALYRLCLGIAALWLAGAPEAQAQALVDQAQRFVWKLYRGHGDVAA